MTHLRALLSKELLDVSRNRSALLPVAIASLMALAIPVGITLAIPALTGEGLSDDADLARVSLSVGPADPATEGRKRGFFNAQVVVRSREPPASPAEPSTCTHEQGRPARLDLRTDRPRTADEERAAVEGDHRFQAERLRRFARAPGRLGRDRQPCSRLQVELRQSVKFMERFSSTLLQDYLTNPCGDRGRTAHRAVQGRPARDLGPRCFGALDEMADELDSQPTALSTPVGRRRGG